MSKHFQDKEHTTAWVETWNKPTTNILEKALAFPWPIEWSFNNGNPEVSLIGVAWGAADSPEMISKGREKFLREKPEFLSNLPYVLALHWRASHAPAMNGEQYMSSRLVRIKDVEGDPEPASALTPSGFVPETFGIHFEAGQATTEYWDFFPASPAQREFLFRVPSANNHAESFKIVLTDKGFVIHNFTPSTQMACLDLAKRFTGAIGTSIYVDLHLQRDGTTLSGTEMYAQFGKSLELKGAVDSLGNFQLLEQYPKNSVTGIFNGKFSRNCRTMTGYFSKPDKSRLLPFEFHQVPQ